MTTVTINNLAQELIDAIIDEVGNFTDLKAATSERTLGTQTLKSCSLVARAWSPRARQYLFHEVEFVSRDHFTQWEEVISCGENTPYNFVQTLHFREKTEQWVTGDALSLVLQHFVAFQKLECLIFTQYDITPLILPLQRAPVSLLESIRYLEVDSMAMNTPQELLALVDCFPHLEDLNLGHGRVRNHQERGAYPERAAERFRGRLYINNREREEDLFLRELAVRPLYFQEVRIVNGPFRQPLCDLLAACAPTLRMLQIFAPSRDSGLTFDGTQTSQLEHLPTNQPFVDLCSYAGIRRLRLSTRNFDNLDDWILPVLCTITTVPEEITLHETPMYQCYGIEYLSTDGWREMDAHLTELASKAAEQGRRLKFVLTTSMFSAAHSEHKLRSRLPSFVEKGTLTILRGHPTYNYARGPF